jgi:hypothetical protein
MLGEAITFIDEQFIWVREYGIAPNHCLESFD